MTKKTKKTTAGPTRRSSAKGTARSSRTTKPGAESGPPGSRPRKYTIIYTEQAIDDIASLPVKEQERVRVAIGKLADNPRPPGVELLKGKPRGRWRIRVGNYRIIYTIQDAQLVVTILTVGDRKEVYR